MTDTELRELIEALLMAIQPGHLQVSLPDGSKRIIQRCASVTDEIMRLVANHTQKALLAAKQVTFTKPELAQLSAYAMHREIEDWYYGPKKHFDKRHESIKAKLEQLAKEQETK